MEKITKMESTFSAFMNMNIVTGNYGKTLEWLRNHDLIPRNPTCCQKEMRLNTSTQRGDVYYWRCLVCRSVRNIRGSTWFGNHPLIPLMALTRIVFYYFANEINAKKTQELLKKEIGCELSIMTIREIYNEVRIKIISYYDVMWVSEKLGIPNAIEMDESLFSHLKLKFNGQIISGDGEEEEEGKEVKKVNSKGRIQIWVIGMIERTTLNVRVFSVKKRTTEVINGICLDNISPGTTIYTDMWRGYTDLVNLGYNHVPINKSVGFVSGSATTNRIESVWSQLKDYAHIYSKGIPASSCDHYLREFLLRRDCRRYNIDMAEKLAEIIAKY